MDHKNRNPWWKMLPLGICLFMSNVDMTAANLALAGIAHDLDMSFSHAQWVLNGYLMCSGAFLILGGRLADALGRRRILVSAVLFFMAGSAMAGVSQSGWFLIISRMIQGVGFLILPLSWAIAHDLFPRQKTGTVMGVVAAIAGLSLAAGPTFGGFLIHALGWRWVFLINLPLGALVIVTAYIYLPGDAGKKTVSPDLAGQALLAGGLFAVTASLNEYAGGNVAPPWLVVTFVSGLVLFVLLAFCEKRSASPLLDPGILMKREFLLANVLRLAMQFCWLGFMFLICLYLQNLLLFSPSKSGTLLLWVTFTMGLLSPFTGKLMDRTGVRIPTFAAFLVLAGAYALLSTLNLSGNMAVMLPCFLLLGVGTGVIVPGTTMHALGAVPGEKTGAATGMVYTSVLLGATVSVAVTGLVLHFTAMRSLARRLAETGTAVTGEQMSVLERVATGLAQSGKFPIGMGGEPVEQLMSIARNAFLDGFFVCVLGFSVMSGICALLALTLREDRKQEAK